MMAAMTCLKLQRSQFHDLDQWVGRGLGMPFSQDWKVEPDESDKRFGLRSVRPL